MGKNELSRRDFIKGTLGASVVLASPPVFGAFKGYDAKGLPTAMLGNTGVRIPRMAIGLGSRFCAVDDEDEAIRILNYALDNGLYYWDTAYSYGDSRNGVISEERLGRVLKSRRNEIFLSTKVASRDPDEAMKQIETSLKRLQTDKLDMLKIHSVGTMEDVEDMSKKGHLIDVLKKMKEQGVTRFIGFTGHGDAGAMTAMAKSGHFDSMLIAMNHYRYDQDPQKRQEQAIPAAREQGMGVMMMKVIRPKETIEGIKAPDLVRYALSLDGPDGLIVGMDSVEVVKSNLEILRSFTPMDDEEKSAMTRRISPFFNHRNLEWMQKGYHDGMMA